MNVNIKFNPYLNSNKKSFLLCFVILYLLETSICSAQTICYPFIKRQYFTNTERVVAPAQRIFSSWNTSGISSRNRGFWMAGYGVVSGANHSDAWLMQFNDSGKFVKSIRFGVKSTGANEVVYDVVSSPSGGALVVGSSVVSSISASLGTISYFSADGKLRWTRQTPSSARNSQSDIITKALVYDANTFVVVGEGSQQTAKRNLIAAQLDSSGITKWGINIDMGNNEHHAQGVARVGNEWVVTGWARSTQTYPFAVFIGLDGKVRKIFKGKTNGINQFGSVVVAKGGTMFAVGTTGSNLTANVLLTAFTANGTIKWTKSIGTNNISENGQHIVLEGSSLWVSSTYQSITVTRQLMFQVDTATGATIATQKILSNGNNNYVSNGFARNFDYMQKGGMVSFGVDNSAGSHHNFMINSPCNTSCGTAVNNGSSANVTWTWDTSSYTPRSFGDLSTLVFDTVSFNVSQAVNCTQACPIPIKTIISPMVLCPGIPSVTVDASQLLAESYSWNDGNTSAKRTFTSEGTYYVNSTNACGTRKDTLIVGKTVPPSKSKLKDTLFCKSPFSHVVDIAQPFCKYVWDNGSTLSTRTFTKPGVYWLDTRNACGSKVDSVRLKLLLPPVSPKIKDTALCVGRSVMVDFNKVNASLYTWPDADTVVPKLFYTTEKVILKINNLCGLAYDTFDIKIKFSPTKSRVKDTTFCSSQFAWDLNMTQSNVIKYEWDDLTNGPLRLITGSGKFWLTLSNVCGVRTDTFNIYFDTFPEKRLKPNEYFCAGTPYTLKGLQFSGYSKYSWNTGAKTGDIKVSQSGVYVLTTKNDCGIRFDTVTVFALRCDCKMWMPTAFTPFGSRGLNDELRPRFVDDWGKDCAIKTGYWSVYNRWGECIFDKRPLSEAWNGIYMDEPVQTGMYVYIIHAIFDETVSGFRNFDRQGTVLVFDSNK